MHARTPKRRKMIVACVVLALLLAACSSGPSATKGPEAQPTTPAESVATKVAEPTAEPEATPEVASDEGTLVANTVDNLVKLAPVHLVSQYEYKEGDEVTNKSRFEADVDANGNQHLWLYDQSDAVTEMYIVDKTMYIGMGGGQFVPTGEVEDDASFAILAVYGGAYFLAYNNLEDARNVGSESVNGYQAVKYEINYDLASLGLGGLVANAQGAEWTYQGFAWVDSGSGALVRGRVDWSGKAADSDVTQSIHSEFDATPGTVTEITAPENVLSLEQ
jgi:hypothetical protein